MKDIYELLESYAEMNNLEIPETINQYVNGHITNNELWIAWLEYEGIYGYDEKIKQIALELFAPEKLQ